MMPSLPYIAALAVSGAVAAVWLKPIDEDMVPVPAGSAILGAEVLTGLPGPKPYDVARFRIDRFEVSNAQYAAFAAATGHAPSEFHDEDDLADPDQPVTGVRWADAKAYCNWLGKRLPTEVEWEKAARGTTGQLFPWGPKFDAARAHLSGKAPSKINAHPNDQSPYGVQGLAGNVSEWVADTDRVRGGVCGTMSAHVDNTGDNGVTLQELFAIYGEAPPGICSTADIPASLAPIEPCAFIKGNNFSGLPHMTVSSNRMWDYADTYAEFVGFRCARDS